ncbi:MAG: hypothetical protein J6Q41_01530 [Firmicutes bacterium]|nr:hypothetical protein [Bacillota bacterium]
MKKTIRLAGIIALIILVASLCLVGCGTTKVSQESPEDAAKSFMDALQNGELEKVKSLGDERALYQDLAFIGEMDGFAESLVVSLGADPEELTSEAKKAAEELQEAMIKEYVKSYEITDVAEEGDSASVTCEVAYGYDPETISEGDYSDVVKELLQNYIVENYEELSKIMTEEGDEALTKRMINDMLPEICDSLIKILNEDGGKNETIIIGEAKQEGKWVITDARIAEAGEEDEAEEGDE